MEPPIKSYEDHAHYFNERYPIRVLLPGLFSSDELETEYVNPRQPRQSTSGVVYQERKRREEKRYGEGGEAGGERGGRKEERKEKKTHVEKKDGPHTKIRLPYARREYYYFLDFDLLRLLKRLRATQLRQRHSSSVRTSSLFRR